jgi:K+-transporting ATPase ATPase C chain
MFNQIWPALKLTLLTMLLLIVVYPLVVWLFAPLSPGKGMGETIEFKGRTVGFALVGQKFSEDKYFQSRPSAVAYNAAGSGGSNKGPSNLEYLASVQARIDTFLVHNPNILRAQVPTELVTASASGLDPDVSIQGAVVQIPRIAKIRGVAEQKLVDLVARHAYKPVFGPTKINLLKLNVDLDKSFELKNKEN